MKKTLFVFKASRDSKRHKYKGKYGWIVPNMKRTKKDIDNAIAKFKIDMSNRNTLTWDELELIAKHFESKGKVIQRHYDYYIRESEGSPFMKLEKEEIR